MNYRMVAIIAALLLVATPAANASDSGVGDAATRTLQEYQYVMPKLPGQNTSYPIALSIMNYVVGHVSAPNYGYLNEIAHNPTAGDVEDILQRQAGICGAAQLTFAAIASQVGLVTRKLYIWYTLPDGTLGGHATNEVYYNDGHSAGWHWFDATWGIFYRDPSAGQDDVLSLTEVLNLDAASRDRDRIQDRSLLWTQVVEALGKSQAIGTGYYFPEFPHLTVQTESGETIYQR
jgi:Transglutaminase-like superfamily